MRKYLSSSIFAHSCLKLYQIMISIIKLVSRTYNVLSRILITDHENSPIHFVFFKSNTARLILLTPVYLLLIWYNYLYIFEIRRDSHIYLSDSFSSWNFISRVPFNMSSTFLKLYTFDPSKALYKISDKKYLYPKAEKDIFYPSDEVSSDNKDILLILDSKLGVIETSMMERVLRNPIIDSMRLSRYSYDVHYYLYPATLYQTLYQNLYTNIMGENATDAETIYKALIFESFDLYLNFISFNHYKHILDSYILKYGAGIVVFANFVTSSFNLKGIYPLQLINASHCNDLFVVKRNLSPSAHNYITRIVRDNHYLIKGPLEATHRSPVDVYGFHSDSPEAHKNLTFKVITYSCEHPHGNVDEKKPNLELCSKILPTVLIAEEIVENGNEEDRDINKDSTTRTIFIGGSLHFWPFKLILADVLHYFIKNQNPNLKANESKSGSLDRYVLIDIDDVLVGEVNPSIDDIKSLIDSQNDLRLLVKNFTYNLGFSGMYNNLYSTILRRGYHYLIKNNHNFWWFLHSWDHKNTFLQNLTTINSEIKLNFDFAKRYNLDISACYSISPAHSGIYPIADILYETWQNYGIHVSSTYYYPNMYPSSLRRAFIYKNITVLPRKTCGIYTHTLTFANYTGGIKGLNDMIKGGNVFDQLLYDKFNLFMTHIPNYSYDRLAIYIFKGAFEFITNHTNLRFSSVKPDELARLYMSFRPQEDKNIVYKNPCFNRLMFAMWNRNYECYKFPKLLIVGPQKSGTTALLSFLLLHPLIRTNVPTKNFEETQFFSSRKIYENFGINWYMDLFRLELNFPYQKIRADSIIFVDKSANYFDSKRAPLKAYNLLPTAKIIVILIDPIYRAYSWYQHAKRHSHAIALNYTFHQVVTFDSKLTHVSQALANSIADLRDRCLNPGKYYLHLINWLRYYSSRQIFIVDGVSFKINPIPSLNGIQEFLNLSMDEFRFHYHVRFKPSKKMFCPVVDGIDRCLGKNKGAHYPEMDHQSKQYLQIFYNQSNGMLYKLLKSSNLSIPVWLDG
ncbi:bifunctional heparan sulfate N-deacetylase/N-sulfotransferase 4-like isoform X1 [Gordionus sp. m RMFG-2023]|uniref:bifunctional heparan sulfate N-deacetylase/N-sulfotransferase 4-like isoform X1 n=1 Tax=Gordionus sp. m RMFG-2023 TaxID=3053472 RepID=UPI0031FC6057